MKRYIVTGKNQNNVYLRTDSLVKARKEAETHDNAQIWKYHSKQIGHTVLRVYENGKLTKWR